MGKIIELFDKMDVETQIRVLLNETDTSKEYAKQIKEAFNHLTTEGQGIIAKMAESLSRNPDYHEDYVDEDGIPCPPPDSIWMN